MTLVARGVLVGGEPPSWRAAVDEARIALWSAPPDSPLYSTPPRVSGTAASADRKRRVTGLPQAAGRAGKPVLLNAG
ncbi:hypothetical protein NQK81_30420 [Amycolatopsis roodepoortensis]|uniref:hypothetical protein n=1 Tax=Amycolatopsis roodepoortensis TaxID=700274 RepID=UPI00214C961B|nr:hypothetical protein [Amycolatopsis roodepoortensis]UUV29074.1 hypothetical protein NQK81_30420 [Amycolatopsis roodepoortensis]